MLGSSFCQARCAERVATCAEVRPLAERNREPVQPHIVVVVHLYYVICLKPLLR